MYLKSIYAGFIRSTVVLLIVLVIVPVTSAQDCQPATGDPLLIGAILPEGNLLSITFSESLQGVVALVDAVNGCGGVNGRPVELVHIPANDRDAAQAAVDQLRADGIPLIIGSGSLAVSEILWEQQDIVIWEVTESLDTDNPWVFSPRPTNYQLGFAAAEYVETTIRQALGKDELRTALIYENFPRTRQIANGVKARLRDAPLLEGGEGWVSDDEIRDQGIDIVIVAAFDRQADWLWSGLRYENANIAAWVQIGNENNPRSLCQQYGNTDGLISVNPAGHLRLEFRNGLTDGIYEQYHERYRTLYNKLPTDRAVLAASGTYVLLGHILTQLDDDYDAETLQRLITETHISDAIGFMGEGFAVDAETGDNLYAQSIIRQQQMRAFCTVSPQAGATCDTPFTEFPTWRERALQEEEFICPDPT